MMRSRTMQGVRMALAALATSLAFTAPVRAQMLTVAEQDLQFGLLTPGVPMVVTPTDVTRRAAFLIQARGRYSLSFQLPSHLTSADGRTIPLTFGPTDGRLDIRHRITTFDPNTGVGIHINPADQEASVYLGGRAQPGLATPAGTYTATIVMMIVQTGT